MSDEEGLDRSSKCKDCPQACSRRGAAAQPSAHRDVSQVLMTQHAQDAQLVRGRTRLHFLVPISAKDAALKANGRMRQGSSQTFSVRMSSGQKSDSIRLNASRSAKAGAKLASGPLNMGSLLPMSAKDAALGANGLTRQGSVMTLITKVRSRSVE